MSWLPGIPRMAVLLLLSSYEMLDMEKSVGLICLLLKGRHFPDDCVLRNKGIKVF